MSVNIEILMGNHDYLRAGHAYFEFLNYTDGVRFITQPCDDSLQGGPLCLFLPHTKDPAGEWASWDFSHYAYAFMHQTFAGAMASNGQRMEGEAGLPQIIRGPKVYSGDIHVPQVLGAIEYVGSPYHVHFGDRFTPRAILIDRRGRAEDLHFPTISRYTLTVSSVSEMRRAGLKAGDQVKLRIKLAESDKHDWHKLRREATARLREWKVEVHDIELVLARSQRRLIGSTAPTQAPTSATVADAVLRNVMAEELGPDALDLGLELVK